jgi:hypothetical protein
MQRDYHRGMGSKSQLETVAEVIAAFGGVKEMCAIFGGVPSRFGNYKAAGRFPDHMHMRIFVEARERGLNIPPELIGLKKPEPQRELPLQAAE